MKAAFFALHEMTCYFNARNNPQSHRTCNLNRVAGFYKKAELQQAHVGAKVDRNLIHLKL